RVARDGNAGRWFQRNIGNNLLPAADAAQNATRMVALETRLRDFVAVLAAAKLDHVKTVADFDAFHRVDAHQRVGDVGVKAVTYRLAPASRHAVGHHGDFRTNGVALFFQATHQLIQRVQLVGIGAEERVELYLIPVFAC